ncbi:MAG: PAS domain S-box protein, partial [Alphaproteobacteria bacterium]|nr:PAS domain S-box protein [Alphaproteobacteria bacterium]
VAATMTAVDDGKIVLANDLFLQSLNWKREDVIWDTAQKLWLRAADRPGFIKTLEKHGTIEDFSTTLRRGDEQHAHVLISANRISLDGSTYLLSLLKEITPTAVENDALTEEPCVALDITAERNHEEQSLAYNMRLEELVESRTRELAANESNFRLLSELSLIGLAIVRDDRFLFVNHAWETIFEYSISEILELESAIGMLGVQDQPMVAARTAARTKGKYEAERYELRARHKDGTLAVCRI